MFTSKIWKACVSGCLFLNNWCQWSTAVCWSFLLLENSAVRIFNISNRIVTSVFDSIQNEYNYSKFPNTYLHQFLTYLMEWRRFFTLATTPSNQHNRQTWSCLLAHYGPPSTETPTTETTTVQCHKNSWIFLTSTYYWWLLRPTIIIRFDLKFQIVAHLFDSIRNEKTLFEK